MRVALVLLFLPAFAAAQRATRSSVGSIARATRDSAGHPIAGVTAAVVNGPTTRSNDSGVYRLDGLAPGSVLVTYRHVGFAPETLKIAVVAGAVATRELTMRAAAVELEAELVSADRLRGKMGPFNSRKARGVGSFITREEIERRQPGSVSELLRYVPGVGVTQKMAGEPQPVHMQRSSGTMTQSDCEVKLYVDGHPYPNGNVDDFEPMGLEGIEVYRSASEIPADFRTRDATCGVISLWTRDPEAARRKP